MSYIPGYYKPVRTFIANEGEYSVDDRGPEALKFDLDEINKMFDPTATHEDGEQGGVTFENLKFDFGDEDFAGRIGAVALEHLGSGTTVAWQLQKLDEHIIDLEKQTPVIATITKQGSSFLCNKTYSELSTLISDGHTVYLDYGGIILSYFGTEENALLFSSVRTDDDSVSSTHSFYIKETTGQTVIEHTFAFLQPSVMLFHINEDGHLIFSKMNGQPIDFSLDSTGHLIMEMGKYE